VAKDKKAAKADTKGKKVKEDAKEEKSAEREFKFGVEDLAEELGLKATSVRVKLRNAGVEKAGKSYGWNSKKELQEVIDSLKSDDEDDKPAKKSKKVAKEEPKKADKGKAAKKGSSKKKAKDEEDDDDDD
jgi:hypothetical protein